MTVQIPVNIAAQVVAAGIYGKKARFTVVFVPVYDKDAQKYDLVDWPKSVEKLLSDGKGLEIIPLGQNESWRTDTIFNSNPTKIKKLAKDKLRRFSPAVDLQKLTDYWRKVMGDDAGFEALKIALDPAIKPALRDPLEAALRDPEQPGPFPPKIPDIHGTWRDKGVKELSFERAAHIAATLRRETLDTRAQAKSADALSIQIKSLKNNIGPWPKTVPLTDARLAAMAEDVQAYGDLKGSRIRADEFAAARKTFQDKSKSSKEAIEALTGKHPLLLARTPLAAALHFGNSLTFTDPTKRLTLEPVISKEAKAAYRLASRTQPFDGDDSFFAADSEAVEFARRRLFALQSNPSLGRLFRFVVDFDCDVSALVDKDVAGGAFPYMDMALDRDPTDPSELPAPAQQESRFLLLRLATADGGSRVWSSAKLRAPADSKAKNTAGHFLPCTREEIDARVRDNASDGRELAVFEQIDGIVDLGQHWHAENRYQIISLDPVLAIGGDDAKEKRRAENKKTLNDPDSKLMLPQVRDELADKRLATQRGGGLALTDRWRQLHGIARFLDSTAQRDQFDPKAKDGAVNIVLDASDLTVGYKLDVGVRPNDNIKKDRNYWHTLMHRTVRYSPTKKVSAHVPVADFDGDITKHYPDSSARRDADDAQLQAPSALRDWLGESETLKHTTVFMEEVMGAWRGDPLGLACGVQSHKLSPQDLRIDISYDLPTDPALTPPPLRFGWHYHFGLRAFFAGGVSLPLNRAVGHYEKSRNGELALPKADNHGTPLLRYERLESPAIAIPDWLFGELKSEATYTKVTLRGRFAVPQASRMLVRSFDDPVNRSIADVPDDPGKQSRLPGVGFDRRVILAPAVTLDFAALHDAFRGKKGKDIERGTDGRGIKMCDPRVLLDPANPNDSETIPIDKEEEVVEEFTPVPKPMDRANTKEGLQQVWAKVRVAWRPYTIVSRPRGGLQGVDHRAAWGGFPVYRARASRGAAEPVLGQSVAGTPAPMTDEGEIRHRIKTAGPEIFKNDNDKKRSILWSAVGVLRNTDGLVDRSGTAVFRPLPSNRDKDVERQPYYPDPAAVTLVIQVAVRGDGFETKRARRVDTKSITLYKEETFKGAAPPDYPDAVPVVLDVMRGNSTENLIKVNPRVDYGNIPHTPPPGRTISAAHVTVTLAPGEQASIRCWCVPTVTFLTHIWAGTATLAAMAVVNGSKTTDDKKVMSVKDVTQAFKAGVKPLTSLSISDKSSGEAASTADFAGLPLPPSEIIREFATAVRERMLQEPLPEIAAITEIEAVHAVDLPQQAPRAVAGQKWQLLRAQTELINDLLLPEQVCKTLRGDLCMSANWTPENQMSDAVDVLIDGSLTVHGASTEAVEIRARGTAAARGRFDDVERGRSRDDRARGLWPKPDAQEPIKAKRLFGFDPAEDGSVSFEPETVTLLRVEGFLPGTSGEIRINLLNFQRDAKAIEPKPNEPIQAQASPLRAFRPAAFPDARARWIEIFAVAISRHTAALRTRYDELPEVLSKPSALASGATKDEQDKAEDAISKVIMDRRWLPATVRPARVVSLSPIPAFAWNDNVPTPPSAKIPSVFVSRTVRVRIRAQRPWFSSGEGERLGIVIWPPNLFDKDVGNVSQDVVRPSPADRKEINLRALPPDGTVIRELQDADLGTGGAWVTRWGADPIRTNGGVQGWLLSKDNFPGVTEQAVFSKPPGEHPKDAVLVKNVLMPVPVDADAAELRASQPPGGFMSVSLITYGPRFDPDQETWHVDVDLNPCGAAYPFVRLGLVRYQPNALRALQVSEPIVEWAQVMPERKLSASAKYIDKERKQVEVTAMLEGVASGPDANNGHPETSPAQAPRVYFTLLQRRLKADDAVPDSELVFAEPQIPAPVCGCASWTAVFRMSDDEYRGFDWSIFAEEVDRLRPATYADEPRYETREDVNFVDTGPRFAGRLSLTNLKVQ